jgi:glycosyltransferase involved in cell wall biosynthesis
MDYLLKDGDIHKYDTVLSQRIWGQHLEKPMYSIMIPTYKRIEFLKEAIYSARNQQGVEAYEIVIVDNNDDDEAIFKEVLELIKTINCPRIIYYRNEKNIGIYGNTLRAAQLSRGNYVVLLNDDDLLHPYYLKVMQQFQKKYHYKGIVGTQPSEFYQSEVQFKKLPDEIYAFQVSKVEFFFGCCVTSPGLLYPREILYHIYNAHEELLMGDQIIQYKALEQYGLVFIAFPLALYRIHNNVTLQEKVLSDMIYHMCGFRKQTADRSLFLKLFSAIFYKEYCSWYIESSLYFWKKRGMKREIYKKMKLQNHDRYTMKQLAAEAIIDQLHQFYQKKHSKINHSILVLPEDRN